MENKGSALKKVKIQYTDPIIDHKSSTTSSIMASSTITKPDVKSMVHAVATILQSQMLESSGEKLEEQKDLYYFSEEKYIREKPEAFDEERLALLRETPTIDNINEFIQALYDCAQFSPECCVICLIYINRIIAFTGMHLHPSNWRPLVLCALLVGQKVWDDRYLSNADFAFIYPFFTTEEINRLEQKFLELIQYNVTVKASLYAKYYYELRTLYKDNEKEFPLTPLNNTDAGRLEIRSHKYQEAFTDVTKEKEKMSSTIGSVQTISKEKRSTGYAVIN
eukprot:TRINITY_DN6531_c0_g1_i6.p1 TRINITY_DN6531_c0_g1~~TRINITY_DN6531_c0_g1_i6.p1  ORF type:complete len:279 (+),score=94.46 TRINITY_DN6531_c0_g1_i6:694-1530(+)